MRVLGIDPAPKKGLAVFDGQVREDRQIPVSDAHDFLRSLQETEDILVCWDAPLTGPSRRALKGKGIARPSDFTQRPVESFFKQAKYGFPAPPGISVSGYAACQHWTLSRSLLGLPRVGTWDRDFDKLPFQLAHQDEHPRSGRWIVEVHPAVAVWLWCQEAFPTGPWHYKKDGAVRRALWREVVKQTGELLQGLDEPETDDELDARVAYALGRLWIEGTEEVQLLGSLEDGTFLLPSSPDLLKAFEAFEQ